MAERFPTSLPIPEVVVAIARRLEEAGHATWCVGGAVRDNLLGIPNHDFDLATAAPPDVVRRLFRRTIPVGIEHGTVAVMDESDGVHEVTTFRRDVRTDGRHAVVEFGASLDEDLARRDFTINAIAYHPLTRDWRDPFDGAGDLAAKRIRAVGDPATRFREDFLRIVRALRFAARFDFAIDAPTLAAAREQAAGLRHLSPERVRDEWFKGLTTARRPSALVTSWSEVGALALWLPEIEEARGPELDGFDEPDAVLFTAFLSRDPAATLGRLRCSNAEVARGRRLGECRERWPDAADPRAVRRWMADAGQAVDDLVAIARARGRADVVAAVERVRASGDPLRLSDLAVTGDDLLAAGVPKGPAVGRMLHALLREVVDDPALNRREALLSRIPSHLSGAS